TLQVGVIVVQRISKQFVAVKLESGIEGIVNAQYIANIPDDPHKLVKKGQMVPSVIIDIKFDLDQDHVFVELSIREKELLDGGQTFRRVFHDKHWNHTRYEKDKDNLERKKRQQSSGSQRVIKHSNFHEFNASQAEVYLEKQQRGDAGIRPSSRGREHLAVTLEVGEGLISILPNICSDVTDWNPDPTGQSVGSQLVIEANHVYSDLDKLIVNHAQAMSHKVELERMVCDGFIADEDEDEDDDKDEEKEKERCRCHKHRIRKSKLNCIG
ncbi:SH2 domain-containing protein, partial [Coprinopsis sp. MPI-PUGE-AT-0042]